MGSTLTGSFRRLFAILTLALAAATVVVPQAKAVPNAQAVGAVQSTNGASISVPWPAHQANDIGLMLVQTANQAITVPAGWAHVLNSPQGSGTAGNAGSVGLNVLWKRAASNAEANVTVNNPGDHVTGMIITFRGVIESGDPWNVGAGGIEATVDTSVSIPGATTTVPDTLVVAIVGHAIDTTSTTRVGAWANASLAAPAIAEIAGSDQTRNPGRGGGFAAASGGKAAAGLYNATTATLANSSRKGLISLALRPGLALGNGTDPANAAIGPGGAATMDDAFTFRTSSGTNVVSAVVVGLAAGTSGGLSLVEITNDAGTTVYGSVTDPGSDTPAITLSTNTLTATTTSTQYKIRVTPKSHANMPAPPGSSYAVTAMINSWTSTYPQTGSDTAGTTVTIDNLSPSNVSGASCTAGNAQNSLAWTNPGDGDFNSVVVLRNTAAVADTPVEGTAYSAGNTIGASTVACATASTGCTDTGLINGTAYHYRLFARDGNGNYSQTGVVPTGSPCTPIAVASFNVVETGADPVTGRIFTKIAAQDISVDIVARDGSNNLVTGFTGAVTVELVDASTGGGVCASMTQIKLLSNQTFTGGDAGRHPLSAGQFESNSWRNVKFRISHPTSSPTVTSCSTDAFAIRPLQFVNILVRDQDRTTAGTTRTLDNTANPGTGNVHNAGRPFRIDATARNNVGADTTNYTPDNGQPVAVLSQCGVAAVCPATPGAVTASGNYSVASGVITNATAGYNDVGAFNLVLQDQTFTAVDSTDPGYPDPTTHYISSSAVTVGRFVPDYFSLEAGSAITPRSDIGACSGSSFTYMGERMDLVFTLRARDSANNVTPNYTGATLGALVLNSSGSYGFGAIDSIAPTPLTARLDLSLIATIPATWSAGSANITAPVGIQRAASPDGPYASLGLGIAPSDPDAVTLQAIALNLDADNSGGMERARIGGATAVRFGRLRLLNASGGLNLDLPVNIETQHWNGSGFVTNAADTCTTLSAGSLSLGSYTAGGGITSSNLDNSHITPATITFVSPAGVGNLKLTKPDAGATAGSATLTVDLVAESKAYLQGNWGVPTFSANPSSRVSFGTFGAKPRSFIFNRENY